MADVQGVQGGPPSRAPREGAGVGKRPGIYRARHMGMARPLASWLALDRALLKGLSDGALWARGFCTNGCRNSVIISCR